MVARLMRTSDLWWFYSNQSSADFSLHVCVRAPFSMFPPSAAAALLLGFGSSSVFSCFTVVAYSGAAQQQQLREAAAAYSVAAQMWWFTKLGAAAAVFVFIVVGSVASELWYWRAVFVFCRRLAPVSAPLLSSLPPLLQW